MFVFNNFPVLLIKVESQFQQNIYIFMYNDIIQIKFSKSRSEMSDGQRCFSYFYHLSMKLKILTFQQACRNPHLHDNPSSYHIKTVIVTPIISFLFVLKINPDITGYKISMKGWNVNSAPKCHICPVGFLFAQSIHFLLGEKMYLLLAKQKLFYHSFSSKHQYCLQSVGCWGKLLKFLRVQILKCLSMAILWKESVIWEQWLEIYTSCNSSD